jgi:hypothetical protein
MSCAVGTAATRSVTAVAAEVHLATLERYWVVSGADVP